MVEITSEKDMLLCTHAPKDVKLGGNDFSAVGRTCASSGNEVMSVTYTGRGFAPNSHVALENFLVPLGSNLFRRIMLCLFSL